VTKQTKIRTDHDESLWIPQLKDLMESLGYELDDNTEVPMPNVTTASLKKVIEYMEHYQDTPQPTSEEIKDKLAETISPWDEEFLKMPLAELYDLVSRFIC
jgi:S-phase kinase-associated protein 1